MIRINHQVPQGQVIASLKAVASTVFCYGITDEQGRDIEIDKPMVPRFITERAMALLSDSPYISYPMKVRGYEDTDYRVMNLVDALGGSCIVNADSPYGSVGIALQ